MPLIPADNSIAVIAALMVLSGASMLLAKTRLGAQLTGTVIVILGAIAASNLNIIPHSAPAYGFVFTYLVPVLIPLFLFQADLRRIVTEASRTTAAFLLATVGTVAGVTVAALLLDLSTLGSGSSLAIENREAGIVGLFASTYIGGSVNYAALGEITGLNEDASFFSAATAADNLFSAIYLSLIALIPGVTAIARFFPSITQNPTTAEAGEAATESPITATSLCLGIAASLSLVAITDGIESMLGLSGWRYIILTALVLIVATLVPNARRWFSGAFELGIALSFVFFAAIAAGADIPAMLSVAPLLISLVCILLVIHLAVLLSVGSLFKLTLPELLTASNAAILGATTAPAMAAAKGWRDQITPGVLVGVLGYALGTFIGTALFKLW
ncbi:MAG: DUF819 family protein [Halieaceae bacterium]|jgi:uncharacterized membrane protein